MIPARRDAPTSHRSRSALVDPPSPQREPRRRPSTSAFGTLDTWWRALVCIVEGLRHSKRRKAVAVGQATRERRRKQPNGESWTLTVPDIEAVDDVEEVFADLAIAREDTDALRLVLTSPLTSPDAKRALRASADEKRRRLEDAGEHDAAALYADLEKLR